MNVNPRAAGISAGVVVIVAMMSCGFMGGDYFQDRVNEATQDTVEKKYGAPHQRRDLTDGGETWTYYRRGSATASYAGQSRDSSCRAYVLTFDKERVLRDWKRESCR